MPRRTAAGLARSAMRPSCSEAGGRWASAGYFRRSGCGWLWSPQDARGFRPRMTVSSPFVLPAAMNALSVNRGSTASANTARVAHRLHLSRSTQSGVIGVEDDPRRRFFATSRCDRGKDKLAVLVAPATGFALKPLATGHGSPRCSRSSPSRFGSTLGWNSYLVRNDRFNSLRC